MAIPSFFKQNKPRGFNYVPRYYDPAKEEREQRLRAWKNEHALSGATQSRGAGDHGEEDVEHPSGIGQKEQGAGSRAQSPTTASHEGETQPYRSQIMRGDMKNYFHRRKERVERHTTIRLLVIILIIVLVVYLYLHF